MCWKDEALGAPMRKKPRLSDNHRYTDLSGQAKCLIGTNSLTHEKYKYALKNHPKTMQDLGEYSVLTRFLMCPGGKWKDSTWAEHKAAMLSAGLNEAGMKKYNLNEANMCLHFGSRLEARSLWVAQFDEAVKTSGYDFAGIGSPYHTKKRTADGTGAGVENNCVVGKEESRGEFDMPNPKSEARGESLRTPLKFAKSEARGEFAMPKPKHEKKRPKTNMHGDNGLAQQFFGCLNAKRAEVEVRKGKPGKPISIGSFAASAAPPGRRHVPGVAPNHGVPSKPDVAGAAPNEHTPPKPGITVYEVIDDSPEMMDTEGFEDPRTQQKGIALVAPPPPPARPNAHPHITTSAQYS